MHGMVKSAPVSLYLQLTFGRPNSPGRAFAALIQKTLLARIVTSYDLKLEENAPRSLKTSEFGIFVAPDPTTQILMRRRL